jgi:hypothetical protein
MLGISAVTEKVHMAWWRFRTYLTILLFQFCLSGVSNVPIFVLDDKYVLGVVIGLCDEQPAPCENRSLGRLPEPVSQI